MAVLAASHVLAPSVAHSEVVVRMETSLGNIDIELFDETAPITVANFLNYVRDGDYDNSFIHRSALSPLIIQGGGYIYENASYTLVPADAPILNEYGSDRPNSRGTIAMARTANPNSATSQWFINIGNNSAALGPANSGGYAVFGRVLDSNDDIFTTNDGQSMQVADEIASLDRFNGTGMDNVYSGSWTQIPFIGYTMGEVLVPEQHLVMIRSVRETNHLLRVTSQASNSVTLTVPSPARLANLTAIPNPDLAGAPAGVEFAEGFFSFEITGLTAGASTMVAMQLPDDYRPNTYYMHGPTPDNASPHWYEFRYNGQTGAEFFDNNYIVLHFVDGQRGDADLTANGQISDPGAPGISTDTTSSSGGGGGCTMSTNPDRSFIHMDYWLLALAVAARLWYRTRMKTQRWQAAELH